MNSAARFASFFAVLVTLLPMAGFCQELKAQETGLYRDMFDQGIYYESTGLLHLDRLYRTLFRKEARSRDVNAFDEVPDNSFFINRHGRKSLTSDDLERGYTETPMDLSGPVSVMKGKSEGLHPGFFVRDTAGNNYLIKFDSFDYFELATAAEIISSRFYHAIGYNVPQYDVVTIGADQLQVGENASIIDDTGFKKPLNSEKLEEFLLFVPRDTDGNFRVSASKLLKGENKGFFNLTSRRKSDPEDAIDHEHRRDVRALQVFASWLNNNDTREGNTLDMLVEEDGRRYLKHYLIDFNSTLGSAAKGAKPPMFGYEYFFDGGETLKTFFTLGLLEKPWQRRWRESGEKITTSPALGYFDNSGFRPDKYKVQLPHFAFKNLTKADGFWAAKIIKSFSDGDIRAILGTGKLSSSEDVDYLAKTLVERRDIIAKYWFEEANPLDDFTYSGDKLSFADLSVKEGFASAENTRYVFDVIGKQGNKGSRLATVENGAPALQIQQDWFSQAQTLDILVRTLRGGKSLPPVLVEVNADQILGILHQD